MDETNNDLYPVQLKDPEVPIQEDCTSDVVPEDTTKDRKSTRLNSSHPTTSRMPSSA